MQEEAKTKQNKTKKTALKIDQYNRIFINNKTKYTFGICNYIGEYQNIIIRERCHKEKTTYAEFNLHISEKWDKEEIISMIVRGNYYKSA